MTIISFLLYWASFQVDPSITEDNIQVQIDGIQFEQGDIYLVIYDNAAAFDAQADWCYEQTLSVSSTGSIDLDIPGRAAGNYSIAIYHDVNGNGEMDKNFLGIPKEPYGFSQNPRAKWKAPTFEETAISLPSNSTISIELQRWKER